MENILSSVVMENYYRLSADELDQIVAASIQLPPRGRSPILSQRKTMRSIDISCGKSNE